MKMRHADSNLTSQNPESEPSRFSLAVRVQQSGWRYTDQQKIYFVTAERLVTFFQTL
jgi:hypothetical protein